MAKVLKDWRKSRFWRLKIIIKGWAVPMVEVPDLSNKSNTCQCW